MATGNQGKKREFQRMLPHTSLYTYTELTPKDLTSVGLHSHHPPEETGTTFLENARIKAQFLHGIKKDKWVLADDSGLIVPDLGGEPGIHSARYAGHKASSKENNRLLLSRIQGKNLFHPRAFFHCTLVALDPGGKEFVFEGQLEGYIVSLEQGQGGFGYDPLFTPQNSTKTLAQHTDLDKDKISHRAQALREFKKLLPCTP